MVEMRREDLLGGNSGADPGAGLPSDGDGDSSGEGDLGALFAAVREFNQEVQVTIRSFSDLIQQAAAARGQAPALAGGQAAGQAYQPAPSPQQQIIIALHAIQAQAGDVTVAELVELLLAQYGGLRLSELIKKAGG